MGGRIRRRAGRRVLLVHWKTAEAADRLARLRAGGIDAVHGALETAPVREIRAAAPAAIVVDLGRLPSHGLAVGLAVRQSPSLRPIPLVFVDGAPEKVARVRAALPDARYCGWEDAVDHVRDVLRDPPPEPRPVPSVMAGYSGRPLPGKLDIREGDRVSIPGAPDGFETTLGTLPAGAVVDRAGRREADVVVWFPRDRADYERSLADVSRRFRRWLWIAWRKGASGDGPALTQTAVRRVGLAAGLVDSKICAIDETWSGLRFSVRRR